MLTEMAQILDFKRKLSYACSLEDKDELVVNDSEDEDSNSVAIGKLVSKKEMPQTQ